MKKIIIANWKMKLSYRDSKKLAVEFGEAFKNHDAEKDIVVCPSFSSFLLIAEVLKEAGIKMGVQDIFWRDEGAFTGCESPKFMHEAGARYAIIGHSERRQYLGETDEMVKRKTKAAWGAGLTPILCVGETIEERRAGHTDQVIMRQLTSALAGLDLVPGEHLVIAYEPVWVIGSGQAIEPQDAGHVFKVIRQAMIDLWPLANVNGNVRIIYGGSIDGDSAGEFSKLDYFGGFLVGGASLDTEEFVKITENI